MPLIDLNGLGHFKDRENAMIAENFAATKNYSAGDYCYFNGTLKKFKTAHAAGAWIGTDAEDAKLAGDVSSLKESISYTPIPRMMQPYCFMKKGTFKHSYRNYILDRNFLRMRGTANNTTYSNIYISGTGEVHGGAGTAEALTANLRDEDFITIPKPVSGKIIFMCSYNKVPGRSANVAGGGQIHFFTKASDGTITKKTVEPTTNPCGYNISDNFPEVIENGNIAISWKNYSINSSIDISAVFELINIFQSFYVPANVLALALENN